MVFPKQMLLASTAVVASAIAGLIAPAGAQTAPSSAPPAAAEQPVSAQTPPTQAAPSGDADSDIVVTGIRGSLRSAIAVKREANAVVDVISAEAIGKFPDRNVAESLSHI